MNGFIDPPVKDRVMLVALESELRDAHQPIAGRLFDARLHGESAQRLHLARADLENGVACKGRVQIHRRAWPGVLHLMRHLWPRMREQGKQAIGRGWKNAPERRSIVTTLKCESWGVIHGRLFIQTGCAGVCGVCRSPPRARAMERPRRTRASRPSTPLEFRP